MKGPEFFGKNLTPEIKESLIKGISERKKQVPGTNFEPEVHEVFSPTLEEKDSIKFAINLVREELSRLELGDQFNISEEEVHIVNTPEAINGVYVPYSQQILINKENSPYSKPPSMLKRTYNVVMGVLYKYKENLSTQKIALIIHELLHGESYQKFVMTSDNRQKKWSRVGYQILREDYNPKNKKKTLLFEGLNEAIVEKTVMDILARYLTSPALSKIHDFLYKRQTKYKNVIALIEEIIKNIAKKKNHTEQEVWEQFKKNQFTGNMMFLRVVEDVYGKGALRKLAEIEGYINSNDPAYKFFKKD